jgi:Putative homoserine kinase type II (protein kinase fold)
VREELERLFNIRDLGAVMSARIIDSYQNQVFDVFATSGHYVVKYYEDELMRKRKMQVDVSRKWQAEGINCILPIGDFYKGERGYYVIYEYFDNEQRKSLNDDDIKKLAQIQAKMHKLDVSSTLPCDYQEIELDIQREGLQDLIQKCNKGLANAKKELVISHNDYKPKNILWHVNEPYLVDFDAVSKVNPTAAAYESAFTFAYEKGSVDVDKFKAYLKEYQKHYSFNQGDYLKYVSMNGKLRWLMFIYGKDWRRDLGLMQELDDLVFELEVFNKYISM